VPARGRGSLKAREGASLKASDQMNCSRARLTCSEGSGFVGSEGHEGSRRLAAGPESVYSIWEIIAPQSPKVNTGPIF